MGRNDYNEEYLAHSKGPWKKHKYIKKVGNRYYYSGSKGYLKAKANDPLSTNTEKKAARKALATRATNESVKRAGRKQRVKNVGVRARLEGQKVARSAKATAKRVGADVKNKVYAAPYAAKAYRDKARFAKKDITKAVKTGASAIARLVRNSTKRAGRMAKVYGDKAHFARLDAQKAAKKTATNIKGKYRYAKATYKANKIKAKQAKRRSQKVKNTAKSNLKNRKYK